MHERIINAIADEPWAITEAALRQIVAIAERGGDIDALQNKVGRRLVGSERTTVRDGVAVVPVLGPLFRRANLLTEISGATSFDTLAADLRAAVEDPQVQRIVLDIDSPGGQANGVSELAQQIRAANQVKPVTAYVGGSGASGGYWLAAAAGRIVAADTAFLGSIGVRMTVVSRDPAKGEHRYEFVSAVSPFKASDPESAEGRSQIQTIADDLAEVFVQAVADYRGVGRDQVLADFGQGDVLIASRALAAGMIDGVGTFEGLMTQITSPASNRAASGGNPFTAGGRGMNTETEQEGLAAEQVTADWLSANRPEVAQQIHDAGHQAGAESVDADAIRAEAATAERERITAILDLRSEENAQVIAECIADAGCAYGDAAAAIIKAAKAGGSQYLAGARADENALEAPAGSTTDAPGDAATAAQQKAHEIVATGQRLGVGHAA